MGGIMDKLNIAVDFGSDSVKVGYAYVTASGKVGYGKVTPPGEESSYPSWGYYDEENKTWLFAEKVFGGVESSFKTVVKIKRLMYNLYKKETERFYFTEKKYPKFFFPEKTANVAINKLKEQEIFTAEQTPQMVCEEFFKAFYKDYLKPAVTALKKKFCCEDYNEKYVIVYPNGAPTPYIAELIRLLESVVGKNNVKSVSATKAIALYAYNVGYLYDGDKALVLNVGETDTSVTKIDVAANGKNVSIFADGADAHNEPINLGGVDMDEILRKTVECKMANRMVLGQTADVDAVDEEGTHFQQFLLLNNIKNLKTCLSLDDAIYNKCFKNGVPVEMKKDVIVSTKLTRDELWHGISAEVSDYPSEGICGGENSFTGKLLKYLQEELKRKQSKDVTKVIFAGGVAETYGLRKYLQDEITLRMKKPIEFCLLTDEKLLDWENEIYAAAVGGAIFGTEAIKLVTLSAYYYGTWQGKEVKTFAAFKGLGKGTEIPPEGAEFWTQWFRPGVSTTPQNGITYVTIKGEELFLAEKGSGINGGPIVVGDSDSPERANARKTYGLKTVTGGKDAYIYFYKDGRPCASPQELPQKLLFREGVFITGDGKAQPRYETNMSQFTIETKGISAFEVKRGGKK